MISINSNTNFEIDNFLATENFDQNDSITQKFSSF